MTSPETLEDVRVPLLIGVTGHRDLLATESPGIRSAVREFLTTFRAQHPATPLRVASLMAEGADLLVVEEALELGIDCVAVLPLPLDTYREDFNDPDTLLRFEKALSRCKHQLVNHPGPAPRAEVSMTKAQMRVEGYARGGELIAGDCLVLLALWDGRPSDKRGGTAATIEFRLSRKAWLSERHDGEPEELLPTLPVDLVYHVVVSRSEGPPAPGLTALEHGYRRSLEGPLEKSVPQSAEVITARTAELNRDLARHARAIAEEISQNQLIGDLAALPPSLAENARLYHAVDWVAGRMRRKVDRTLYFSASLSLVMGFFFLLFGHASGHDPERYAIIGFILAFVVLVSANGLATSGQWHRRYLEYRTLAEGLRVELFWALAGVAARGPTPAVHRTLLKQSDASLEWIPNAIRALSLSLKELRVSGIAGGVQFALQRWVGTDSEQGSASEQLHYYRRAARHMSLWADIAEGVAIGATLIGVGIAVLLAFEVAHPGDAWHAWLMGAMGLLPLIGGVIEALVGKTAARELQRQYEYMFNVFQAARDRLLSARNDDERRGILSLLGRAALEEHADWLLMHRDRPIDRSRIT